MAPKEKYQTSLEEGKALLKALQVKCQTKRVVYPIVSEYQERGKRVFCRVEDTEVLVEKEGEHYIFTISSDESEFVRRTHYNLEHNLTEQKIELEQIRGDFK